MLDDWLMHTTDYKEKIMGAISLLTAIWVACWVATYAPDFTKHESKEQTSVEQTK